MIKIVNEFKIRSGLIKKFVESANEDFINYFLILVSIFIIAMIFLLIPMLDNYFDYIFVILASTTITAGVFSLISIWQLHNMILRKSGTGFDQVIDVLHYMRIYKNRFDIMIKRNKN